jgi:hypothetical protein
VQGERVKGSEIGRKIFRHDETSAIEHFSTAAQPPVSQVSHTEILTC